MANKKEKKKASKGGLVLYLIGALAMIMAAIMIVGCFVGWWSFGKADKPTGGEQQEPIGGEEAKGGALIGESEGKGISMMSAKIEEEDYEEYGISPQADTAYTLTATIEPDDAQIKTVEWSVGFVDPSSDWASGKTVSDYVTLSSTTATVVTVSCLQAFGEQVKVEVASKDNTALKASCTCDYVKRVENIVKWLAVNGEVSSTLDIGSGKTYTTGATSGDGITYGVGTLTPNVQILKYKIELLNANGSFARTCVSNFKRYGYSDSTTGYKFGTIEFTNSFVASEELLYQLFPAAESAGLTKTTIKNAFVATCGTASVNKTAKCFAFTCQYQCVYNGSVYQEGTGYQGSLTASSMRFDCSALKIAAQSVTLDKSTLTF